MRESMFKKPAVVPFVECPHCKHLMEYSAERCPRCREDISAEYAFASAVVVHYNTQACSLANSIKGFDSFVPIALVGSIFVYAIDVYAVGSRMLFYFILIWPVIPLIVILTWFIRFGRFRIGDEEFVRVKRDMRSSFMMWLAILALQVITIIVQY